MRSRRICSKSLPLLLACALAAGGGGCGLFADEYHWSQPFVYEIGGDTGDAMEISNYSMLKSAIIDLVSNHEERGTLRFNRYNGSPIDDLAAACLEIRTTNPLGAYAVSAMTYDTSRIVSYYLAEIQITYGRSREEIQHIMDVSGLPELEQQLRESVTSYASGFVFRVYSSQVSERAVSDLVEEMFLSDPVSVVCEPAATVSSYPSEGIYRIYDVRLRYEDSPEELRLRSQNLSRYVESMCEEIREDQRSESPPLLALEAARRLYAHVSSPGAAADGGSAYDALIHAAAGSKGIALAYKALCSALGIECLVVDGNIGDMGVERHYWNIIGLEDDWYHVDVSRFGGALSQAFLLNDTGLWGAYLWNTERYPECAGPLCATDVAEPVDASEAQEREMERPLASPEHGLPTQEG